MPIPIDFGYSLPNTLDKKPNIDIFKLIPEGPFNKAEKAHIENLDLTELSLPPSDLTAYQMKLFKCSKQSFR